MMIIDDWHMVTPSDLPPENMVVETISPNGMPGKLKRIGRLWFFPDGSMYVYYEPKWWRKPVEDETK